MRIRVIILLALVTLLPGKPRKLWFGGTFIGAIVVDDGIVIGSDSRSTFIDDSGKQFGYIDGMSKVFVEHGTAFAVSGLSSVSGELFNSFIARNDFLLSRPVDEILYGVMLGLPVKNSSNVLLISAGFSNGQMMICGKNPTDPQLCRKEGFLTNRVSSSLNRWYIGMHGVPPRAADAATALERAILESSDLDTTIGGPITILHLRKSGEPEWIENPPTDHGWKTVCDIVSDYRKGSARILFVRSKDELDRNLDATCAR
ncbi:MAG TPA: hypothetical protein VK210_09600 [Terriglobia bacterium]|nr:hypothetical protein [Terriglobia bacterium]